MRILIFPKDFPTAEHPGTGIFILRCAQALRDLGHEIGILRIVPLAPKIGKKWSAYRAIPALDTVDGFPVRTIRAVVPPRMIGMEYLHLQVRRAVRREIERFAPDVVHANFLIPNGQIAVRSKAPVVVTAHGGDAYSWPARRPGLRRAAREAIQGAARVTAVSRFIAACVGLISPRDVDVVWNGADERFFYPRDPRASRMQFGFPAGRPVIAFAGNVLRAKGLFELVSAARELGDLEPIVAIAGGGSDAEALERAAVRQRVDLRLLGALDAPMVGELFGAADVVTLPSHNEGLPNVVCEAMLSARAVVASTAGGTPEIVAQNRTGLLVPPRDAQALAGALRAVATDADLRNRLARGARDFACEHLTWRVSARKYERIYREATNVP